MHCLSSLILCDFKHLFSLFLKCSSSKRARNSVSACSRTYVSTIGCLFHGDVFNWSCHMLRVACREKSISEGTARSFQQ